MTDRGITSEWTELDSAQNLTTVESPKPFAETVFRLIAEELSPTEDGIPEGSEPFPTELTSPERQFGRAANEGDIDQIEGQTLANRLRMDSLIKDNTPWFDENLPTHSVYMSTTR